MQTEWVGSGKEWGVCCCLELALGVMACASLGENRSLSIYGLVIAGVHGILSRLGSLARICLGGHLGIGDQGRIWLGFRLGVGLWGEIDFRVGEPPPGAPATCIMQVAEGVGLDVCFQGAPVKRVVAVYRGGLI